MKPVDSRRYFGEAEEMSGALTALCSSSSLPRCAKRKRRGFYITHHAVARYIERFEGNLSRETAEQRLQRIAAQATFRRMLPGRARLYGSGAVHLVVSDDAILTTY